MEDKVLFISQIHAHSCWWPGNSGGQGISSHDIDIVCPEYFGSSTRRIKPCGAETGISPEKKVDIMAANDALASWYKSQLEAWTECDMYFLGENLCV